MKRTFTTMLLLLLNSGLVFAHETIVQFPVWTYWIEIVEHSAIILVAIVAIFYLLILYKKSNKRIRTKLNIMMFGLVLLTLSQLLTNLHHFLIYPFGELSAVMHHGLLLISLIVIIYAYFILVKGVKK